LADIFTRELQHGSCGVIKVATSQGRMTVGEEKLYRAAALAQQRTTAPIVSHTTGGLGREQVQLLTSLGVQAGDVMVSHVCSADEPADYALELARMGAMVGLDRVGHSSHDDAHWVRLVRLLADHGCLDRVLLSHDSVQRFDGPADIAGHTFADAGYLTRTFLPALRAAGLNDHEINHVVSVNPRRWLGIGSPE
jgi:phosphotriesterase-related protein